MASKRVIIAIISATFLVSAGIAVFVNFYFFWPVNETDLDKIDKIDPTFLGVYKKAAVACDSAPCSTVGKNILLRNGSAVDAMIATALCNSAQNPQSMGVGGGFFMTIYDKATKTAVSIIAREKAPMAATELMFYGHPDLSQDGGLAIAVPGEVAGYRKAWELYGRLPWSELFNDTINMLQNGFPVGVYLAEAINESASDIVKYEGLKDLLVNPDTGALFKQGEILKDPKLAATLRIIAANWTQFYTGELASTIISEIQQADGIITLADLQNYTAEVKEPVMMTLDNDNMRLYSPPPPASGAVLAYILNVLKGYKMSPDSMSTTEKAVLSYHRMVETFKFAYGERTRLGDQDFVPVADIVKNLTSESLAAITRGKIWDNQTHSQTAYYGVNCTNIQDHGTAQISVISPDGDAASMTSTVNLYFGSKIRGMKTGIIYNDQMDDFSTPNTTNFFGVPPSPANFIVPGKRPQSSMAPTIIVDSNDRVRIVVGGSGGTTITTSVSTVIMSDLWFAKNIKEAIDAPRIHHQLCPNEIVFERGFNMDIVYGLAAKGHNYTIIVPDESVVEGISVAANGTIYASGDFRIDSNPDGF